jgi:DNA-binding beta-propeller fold protein YncE
MTHARAVALAFTVVLMTAGCGSPAESPPSPSPDGSELRLGGMGRIGGLFHQPRYMAIDDARGELFVVDRTDRVQVFTFDGTFLRGWIMPNRDTGNCRGMWWDAAIGRLWVADTHNRRVLQVDREGNVTGVCGVDGDFRLVTGVAPAVGAPGLLWVAQYDDLDDHAVMRIATGPLHPRTVAAVPPATAVVEVQLRIGTQGSEPGDWNIPAAIAPLPDGTAWIANANNHRIDRLSADGVVIATFGTPGGGPGELRYPYDVKTWLASDGSRRLAIAEFGNSRVSVFNGDGAFLAHIKPDGCLTPWGIAVSRAGWLFIASTGTHEVVRVPLPR